MQYLCYDHSDEDDRAVVAADTPEAAAKAFAATRPALEAVDVIEMENGDDDRCGCFGFNVDAGVVTPFTAIIRLGF